MIEGAAVSRAWLRRCHADRRLKIMDEWMGYFYRRFLALKARAKGAYDEKLCEAAHDAFAIAEKIAPYQHAPHGHDEDSARSER